VSKYLSDYATLFTGGTYGNLAATFLGSYGYSYSLSGTILNIHVDNTSSIASATHPPIVGYTEWWQKYIGDPLNSQFSTGPMSAVTQNFDFKEDLKCKNCPCLKK